MKRQYQFVTGTLYHVYNRGYNKQQIFFEDRDFRRFLLSVHRYLDEYPKIKIMAWCLLPNHFHMIVGEGVETGLPRDRSRQEQEEKETKNISDFFRKLQVAYAMFFNTKYGDSVKKGRKSPVFEGRFQARMVEDEGYLSQLTQYVLQNAVHHEIVDEPREWPWVSEKVDTIEALEKFESVFD